MKEYEAVVLWGVSEPIKGEVCVFANLQVIQNESSHFVEEID